MKNAINNTQGIKPGPGCPCPAPSPSRSRSRSRYKLSPTQLEALEKIREHGGKIIRLNGGFWTWPSCPPGYWQDTPSWSVDIKTVRCLEAAGYLVRANVFPEEWRDSRVLAELANV